MQRNAARCRLKRAINDGQWSIKGCSGARSNALAHSPASEVFLRHFSEPYSKVLCFLSSALELFRTSRGANLDILVALADDIFGEPRILKAFTVLSQLFDGVIKIEIVKQVDDDFQKTLLITGEDYKFLFKEG